MGLSLHALLRSALARFLRGRRLASMPAKQPLKGTAPPLFFLFFFRYRDARPDQDNQRPRGQWIDAILEG